MLSLTFAVSHNDSQAEKIVDYQKKTVDYQN